MVPQLIIAGLPALQKKTVERLAGCCRGYVGNSSFTLKGRCVINAAGISQMILSTWMILPDDLCKAQSGIHLVVDRSSWEVTMQ